jgi:hypothetical protein
MARILRLLRSDKLSGKEFRPIFLGVSPSWKREDR